MHRPGSNADAMTPLDFLCDFCLRPWADNGAMVEGHHGSLICTDCLSAAYPAVAVRADTVEPTDEFDCTMCLQHKGGLRYRTNTATACRSCVEKAARMLERDPDSGWTRPADAQGAPPSPQHESADE